MDHAESTYSYSDESERSARKCVAVRVLAHPDTGRVGEFVPLFERHRPGMVELSRLAPVLRSPSGERTGPLETGHVSRTPLALHWSGERLRFVQSSAAMPVEIDGARLAGTHEVALTDQSSDCAVLLGRHVALWIGLTEVVDSAPYVPGLIGESAAMHKLRQDIHRVAQLDVPVLLRGETGVGKELVAAAIHDHGQRSGAAYVVVNVAGIPPTMAAAELFGHRRGAFTGASKEREGYFAQAHGGTLFLDEIGDIASDVQALLLRTVQHGEIQPVGGGTCRVDVRLIAATDSDLESAIARREFREPLLRRFAYELWVPPLRERRDDLGLLFFHLLGEHLRRSGNAQRLAPAAGRAEAWVPAALLARLARHNWPGNVRELANVALHFAVRNQDKPRGDIDPELERMLTRTRPASPVAPASRTRPQDISDDAIVKALEETDFNVEHAAKTLRLSRSYLYKRLPTCKGAVRADDLSADRIADALKQAGGDIEVAAALLRVTARALALRMHQLGLKR